ncbi:hypothetical protein J5J86_15800 [Aquabacter sp. L1I39]|uniref:hypothetical protein n=1 Tax=Aquabacter sp. L1I39 TaxID=2820278 RepID=UPI001AD9AB0B|nr:hypothetical protein [Aquabacter sp. L1I39]QTL02256.1 hypothetical protein J5J86_15800 [Aquabacter sp. L1I39]
MLRHFNLDVMRRIPSTLGGVIRVIFKCLQGLRNMVKKMRLPCGLRVAFIFITALVFGSDQTFSFESNPPAYTYRDVNIRKNEILNHQIHEPFPETQCRTEDYRDPCILGLLNGALTLFYEEPSASNVRTANGYLRAAVTRLSTSAGLTEFHGVRAGLLFRTLMFFGKNGEKQAGLIDPEIEAAAIRIFQKWAGPTCKIKEASREDVWSIWGSENHGAQRDATCWSAARLSMMYPEIGEFKYEDNSNAQEQKDAWSKYLKIYIKSRARNGVLIEYFSPTYAQYTLSPFYNYFDFADDSDLRRLSQNFLDLWWATWAQEQIDGTHGGSKTRAYPSVLANGSPMRLAAFMYFGFRTEIKLAPGQTPAITSAYRPPTVVADIAIDKKGRGTYEVRTRAPGHQYVPFYNNWYDIDPDAHDIVRIAYVTPSFIMGSALYPKKDVKYWSSISCQNRWAGVVFEGDGSQRVSISPGSSQSNRSNCNSFWSVQYKSMLIAQRLSSPYGVNVGPMRIWVGPSFRTSKCSTWTILEGNGYVAIEPAWGSMFPDEKNPNFLALSDSEAPVILQAAERSEYRTSEDFCADLANLTLRISDGGIEISHKVENRSVIFYTRSQRLPKIDGVEISLNEDFVFRSPFIRLSRGGAIVRIAKDGKVLDLNFE